MIIFLVSLQYFNFHNVFSQIIKKKKKKKKIKKKSNIGVAISSPTLKILKIL
jgi:hypothetical protein